LFGVLNQPRPESSRTSVTRTEFEDDRLAYEFARRYIREDSPAFVRSCLHRIGSFWHFLPHQTRATESAGGKVLRWGIAIWYAVVFSLALLGGWHLSSRVIRIPWLWGLLMCFTFTAVHALYWSNMRMRAPLMPFIALLAAVGIATIRSRQRSVLVYRPAEDAGSGR
jgi:hypothetical protein